jgi:hypothetical protein
MALDRVGAPTNDEIEAWDAERKARSEAEAEA